MNEREMQDYIMHYGVKGMRWGHRKDKIKSFGQKIKQNRTKKKINKQITKLSELNRKYKNDYEQAKISKNEYLKKVRKAQIEITNRTLKDIKNVKVSDISSGKVGSISAKKTMDNFRDVVDELKLNYEEQLGVLKLK